VSSAGTSHALRQRDRRSPFTVINTAPPPLRCPIPGTHISSAERPSAKANKPQNRRKPRIPPAAARARAVALLTRVAHHHQPPPLARRPTAPARPSPAEVPGTRVR
jgi:hypothetical protein